MRRLAAGLGVAEREEKVARYYHQMEQGLLDPTGVSARVLLVLAGLIGTTPERLRDAGSSMGPVGEPPGAAAFARAAVPAEEHRDQMLAAAPPSHALTEEPERSTDSSRADATPETARQPGGFVSDFERAMRRRPNPYRVLAHPLDVGDGRLAELDGPLGRDSASSGASLASHTTDPGGRGGRRAPRRLPRHEPVVGLESPAVERVEERAARVLERVPAWLWDGETLPVPIEDIADSVLGLLVRDVDDLGAAPGAPQLAPGQELSGLLLAPRGEIWVNAREARTWPTRRRFTIGHELGHWEMHRDSRLRSSVARRPWTRISGRGPGP